MNYINEASNLFSWIYSWIVEKIMGNNVVIDEHHNSFPENFYDIYYHFKVLEKDYRLGYIVIGKFDYPDSFMISMPETNYKMKINKIDNQIYSCVYFNDELIRSYREFTKRHNNYQSLESEVYITNILARTIDE